MQNAKNKKNVVITTPKTLSASAKTTTAMATDVVDFDFEIELEVLHTALFLQICFMGILFKNTSTK